jgi:HAD superfamily hydrolase (TIGR01484 family)
VSSSQRNGKRRLVLATDLDGTLLGGSDGDRRRLADLIQAEEGFQVVFLTGRNLETIRPYLADPLVPRPDYIVGDVGASVVSGRDLEPIQPLQDEIARAWPGRARVEWALAPFAFLRRQDVPQERRCSYYAPEHLITRELLQSLELVGCSVTYSAGRHLDILPRGVSKGATLLKLIRHEELDPNTVVVAGDSLNDLSMFETELKGVVVGNAETRLKQRTADIDSVFLARGEGAAGILEGLEHHGFVEGAEDAAIG